MFQQLLDLLSRKWNEWNAFLGQFHGISYHIVSVFFFVTATIFLVLFWRHLKNQETLIRQNNSIISAIEHNTFRQASHNKSLIEEIQLSTKFLLKEDSKKPE
jgi:hypothetical protein